MEHPPIRHPSVVRPGRLVLALLAATLSIVTALASGCAPDRPAPAPTPQEQEPAAARLVGPAEFAAAVAEPDRVTVNVHIPFEGDIPGTDLSIPFDQIAAHADRLPADRATGLAIYCRSGPMSTTAAATLRDLGYQDIVELRGGMRAWQADGRPLLGV
ncbi:rhodanese-like domain-containing protein [Mycobacterium sp. B14F4]|uniref:rhodanese-like domain-containing protein n=1 Tax=Mycobacterium sp. B14F4 TaxID=3153565 RepID=UPI00325D4A4D